MKSRNFPGLLLTIAAVTVTCLLTKDVMAQGSSDVATIQNVAPTAAPAGGAPVQLSYGVPQIILLSKAKVSNDTIVNFIRNSGNSYGLDANQIIYLKQQGVSETVINTMLNQPRQAAQATPQPAYPTGSSTATTTAVAQPTVAYVQTVPSSTVYVIPDTQTYNYDTYYYPYYYPYYGGWYYPPVSFSFGFGGGYHGGYYHGGWGGYHGGYHGGGGWHR